MEHWIERAKTLGFEEAVPLDTATLKPRADIRGMCESDQCRAYGKNWTCPPYCGSIEECGEKLLAYRHGILLQTVRKLEKAVDTKGFRMAEQQHLDRFYSFADEIRKVYPNALCLGSGGCRICGSCAWPEPCRFPGKACASMEGYGLFVTQVCRDNGCLYHHGERTVTYTACVLF